MKLDAGDFNRLALRRVSAGGVAKLGSCYFGGGHPVTGLLYVEAFKALLDTGLLQLAHPDPDPDSCGLARVSAAPLDPRPAAG